MAENTVQKLVRQVYEVSGDGDRMDPGLGGIKSNIDKQATLRSISRALLLLGVGLAFLALAFDESWVTSSPIFNLVGALVCCLFLILCIVTGILWWLLTGSGNVFAFAMELLPFGVKPYRPAVGMAVVFIAIALFLPLLLQDYYRLPRIGKHWQTFLVWFRWLLWLLTIGVWVAAIWLNTLGFPKDMEGWLQL